MKLFLILFTLIFQNVLGQELFVWTKPASNLPKKTIALNHSLKLSENILNNWTYRNITGISYGIHSKLMFELFVFQSNMHEKSKFEGFNVHLKYRFLSFDQIHKHFRMATFAKVSKTNYSHIHFNELNLEGDQSVAEIGLIGTQLINKFAISSNLTFNKAINNKQSIFYQTETKVIQGHHTYDTLYSIQKQYDRMGLFYALSVGYLTFPAKYRDHNQLNINVYLGFLGKYNPESNSYFNDLAPSLQFILFSRFLLSLSYRFQLSGNMYRMANNTALLKLEYNIFGKKAKKIK